MHSFLWPDVSVGQTFRFIMLQWKMMPPPGHWGWNLGSAIWRWTQSLLSSSKLWTLNLLSQGVDELALAVTRENPPVGYSTPLQKGYHPKFE